MLLSARRKTGPSQDWTQGPGGWGFDVAQDWTQRCVVSLRQERFLGPVLRRVGELLSRSCLQITFLEQRLDLRRDATQLWVQSYANASPGSTLG